jgi:hypothetical protein
LLRPDLDIIVAIMTSKRVIIGLDFGTTFRYIDPVKNETIRLMGKTVP